MDEKLRFVFEYERDEESMMALCERFEISRETGYVWLRRYRQHGPEGLLELNRPPEAGLQKLASNRAVLLRLKGVVVNDRGKGIGKMSGKYRAVERKRTGRRRIVNYPRRCRNWGVQKLQHEPGRNLFTVPVAAGL